MKNNNSDSHNNDNIVPPKPRKKKPRDLTRALTLRPAEVFALYGIPSSTLCGLCKHADPEKRIPSRLIPGRKGRKGLRLIILRPRVSRSPQEWMPPPGGGSRRGRA